MPIYMDIHMIPGVKAQDVAEAHTLDLHLQDAYGCKCMTYWIDEDRGTVFCLIDAPSKDTVTELHSRAHGLVPNKIIEVDGSLVEAFLGRIYDPEPAMISAKGLKVFHDPSFRILLQVKWVDPFLLAHQLGKTHASAVIGQLIENLQMKGRDHEGRWVSANGNECLLSFISAAKAMDCAISMRQYASEKLAMRMAIHGGEPVVKSGELFGDTIRLLEVLNDTAKPGTILVSSSVQELLPQNQGKRNVISLSTSEEAQLVHLYETLNRQILSSSFDVNGFCRETALSKSQLYRKTMTYWNSSPNELIRHYRLQRSRFLLTQKKNHIAGVCFDCGFSSPSYFTKCFREAYGLTPAEYLQMMD